MGLARLGIGFVLVFLFTSGSAVWAAEAGSQQVRVVFRGIPRPAKALVEAAPLTAATQRHPVEVAVVDGVGRTSVALEGQDSWQFHASAPGWWSAEVEVAAPSEEPVELILWPAAFARAETGVANADATSEPFEEVQLTLSRIPQLPAGAPEQPERAEVVCAVLNERLTDCVVPAGHWNLRIKAAGYIPHFRWATEIPHGEAFDLGQLTFKRGASLFGKVVTSEGAPCPPDARVVLRPIFDRNLGGREELAAELASLTERATINEWGYFHFNGIVARAYQLTAAARGFIPSSMQRVEVRTGHQVELDEPLVLLRGMKLSVLTKPCGDEDAGSLDIELISWSAVEERKKVAEGTAPNGEWISPLLPPGPYAIKVVNERGDRLAFLQIELAEEEQTAWVDLDCLSISGTVIRGEEPLPAKLAFTADHSKVSAESDEDGSFSVMFPRPGKWEVTVSNPEHELECRGISVEIRPDHEEELVIEVPDTAVRGDVYFSNGRAAADAHVKLVSVPSEGIGAYYTDTSGNDGRFELQGVLPGTYKVEASWQSLHSGIETTIVSENGTAPPVQLVLRDGWMLRGMVLSGSEPVPGAAVTALPFTAAGTYASNVAPQTRSGIDGSFALELPHSCSTARVVVMAPGFTIHVATAVRKADEDDAAFVLALTSSGGSLRLARPSQYGVVVLDGSPIPTGFLTQWAMINGQLQRSEEYDTVPAMPVGGYGYCDLTPDEAMLVMAAAAVPTHDRCAEGYLGEGETLSLQAPLR